MRRYRDHERMERIRDRCRAMRNRYWREEEKYRNEEERSGKESASYGGSGRKTLYRSRNGLILGICRGVADRYDIPAFWIRVGVIVLMVTTTVWPVVLVYFGIGFLLKPEPIIPFTNESEDEFYGSFTNSRSMALHRLKKKFDQLQNRLHRMENVVTSKEFNWEMKMKQE
jgi:phage shock protein C